MSDLEHIGCASKGCTSVIAMHPAVVLQYRKSNATFYCPRGHDNFFPKRPDAKDHEIERLKREIEQHSAARERAIDRRDELYQEVLHLRDLLLEMSPPGIIVAGLDEPCCLWKCVCGRTAPLSRPAWGAEEAERRLRGHAERVGHTDQLPHTILVVPEGSA